MIDLKDLKFENMAGLVERAASAPPVTVAVAGAGDRLVLESVATLAREGLLKALLFGDRAEITPMLDEVGMPAACCEVRHQPDVSGAALAAAVAAGAGEAQLLMKGFVPTRIFLRAVLVDTAGLLTGRLLSHLALYDVPGYDRLLGMTDGGINIAPDFTDRVEIVRNACEAGERIWPESPRVALVAAVEKVQSNMPVTMEWAAISQMARRGEFGDVVVDGPLGLDNALSPEAMRFKGIQSPVGGRADILVVPDLQAGNLVGKAMTYLAGAPMAGLVLGARVPVILNSRADQVKARVASLLAARPMLDFSG